MDLQGIADRFQCFLGSPNNLNRISNFEISEFCKGMLLCTALKLEMDILLVL